MECLLLDIVANLLVHQLGNVIVADFIGVRRIDTRVGCLGQINALVAVTCAVVSRNLIDDSLSA